MTYAACLFVVGLGAFFILSPKDDLAKSELSCDKAQQLAAGGNEKAKSDANDHCGKTEQQRAALRAVLPR